MTIIPGYEQVKPNIFINSENVDFSIDVKDSLDKIAANPIGHRLLEKIQMLTSPIFINYGERNYGSYYRLKDSQDRPFFGIRYSMGDITCYSTKGEEIPEPRHVILFHELTHAYHFLSGKNAISQHADPLLWENDEEYRTVIGFPSKKEGKTTPKITENAFRKAEGLPDRFSSWTPIDTTNGIPSLKKARVKLLGKIHEQNVASSSSSNPPSMALHPGPLSHSVLEIEVQDVDSSSQTISRYYWIDTFNRLDNKFGDRNFFRPSEEWTQKNLQDISKELIHELKERKFTVLSMIGLRISPEEYEFLA